MSRTKPARAEYATTEAPLFDDRPLCTVPFDADELTPRPPAGDGWTMCGSTCGNNRIFWFWTRTVKDGA